MEEFLLDRDWKLAPINMLLSWKLRMLQSIIEGMYWSFPKKRDFQHEMGWNGILSV